MQQHLVGGELLLGYVLAVEENDGHAQEQVEVVRLWGGGSDTEESGKKPKQIPASLLLNSDDQNGRHATQ